MPLFVFFNEYERTFFGIDKHWVAIDVDSHSVTYQSQRHCTPDVISWELPFSRIYFHSCTLSTEVTQPVLH